MVPSARDADFSGPSYPLSGVFFRAESRCGSNAGPGVICSVNLLDVGIDVRAVFAVDGLVL